jgi:hypothetical protein
MKLSEFAKTSVEAGVDFDAELTVEFEGKILDIDNIIIQKSQIGLDKITLEATDNNLDC